MGFKFKHWVPRSEFSPKNFSHLTEILYNNRHFDSIDQLDYGDYGLHAAYTSILGAIKNNKKIALYADYDVDGTMSCVSWIWFLQSIGYSNYIHYIPDRFSEGYGVNLAAVKYLAEEQGAQLIITMDTGITANVEAQWCKQAGVDFICTDHHKIQPNKMPDCTILNPKTHPDPLYQELCGCGITFVLLRKLGKVLNPPSDVWTDILALTGMATICDVVPLNGVNHKLAQHGVQALLRSKRPVLKKLLKASSLNDQFNERDIGFKLGPRINAVGRLEHANQVIQAFVDGHPEPLIQKMGTCNERRKLIQSQIISEAREAAQEFRDDPIIFLGGDWHQGVVGIAASKIAEEFWKPVWLYQKKDDICKGSARSLPNFDITNAMAQTGDLFEKFGGHAAAAGFSFASENEAKIRENLKRICHEEKAKNPAIWESCIHYDFSLNPDLLQLTLTDHLDDLRPFGHCFEEPLFLLESDIEETLFYKDKLSGEPKHTAVKLKTACGSSYKVMFFNEVHKDLYEAKKAHFLVTANRNFWQGQESLSLIGADFSLAH